MIWYGMISIWNEQEQMDAQQPEEPENGEEPMDPQGNGYPEAPPEQV